MKNMQAFKTVILLLWIWNNISHLASHLLARTLNQNKYLSLPSSQDPLKYECIKGAKFYTQFRNLISLWICFEVLALRLFSALHLNYAARSKTCRSIQLNFCDIYALVKIINKWDSLANEKSCGSNFKLKLLFGKFNAQVDIWQLLLPLLMLSFQR